MEAEPRACHKRQRLFSTLSPLWIDADTDAVNQRPGSRSVIHLKYSLLTLFSLTPPHKVHHVQHPALEQFSYLKLRHEGRKGDSAPRSKSQAHLLVQGYSSSHKKATCHRPHIST